MKSDNDLISASLVFINNCHTIDVYRDPSLALRMTVGGGKVSWITSVVGWPLDSVILNAVKNLGAWRV